MVRCAPGRPFQLRSLREALRKRGRRRLSTVVHVRRGVAALLFVTAVVLAVQPGYATGEPTEPVIFTTRDLPAGSTLGADDVRSAEAPASFVPSGALTRTDEAIGRVLAGSARAGEPLTDTRMVGHRGRSAAGGASSSAVPIRLADSAVAELLQAGVKVDVVTIGEDKDGSRVLARNATVVTVTSPARQSRLGETRGRLVLISLPVEAATRVAAVSLNQPVTVTLR